MLNIQVAAATADLACGIAAKLEAGGHKIARVTVGANQCGIRYRRGLSVRDMLAVVEGLRPFSITNSTPTDLEDGIDVAVELGTSEPLQKWDVSLYVDSEKFGEELRHRLEDAGFRVSAVHYGYRPDNQIQYGGASEYSRRYLGWVLGGVGIHATDNKEWDDSDDDLWVMLRDPQHEGKRARDYLEVVVRTDDEASCTTLVDDLKRVGYHARIERREEALREFHLDAGPFSSTSDDAQELQSITMRFLDSLGVDAGRHPLKGLDRKNGFGPHAPPSFGSRRRTPGEALRARVDLPVRAWREGSLSPYAGAFPERFPVLLRTDDAERAAPLAQALRSAGFPTTVRKDESLTCPSLQVGGVPTEAAGISAALTQILADSGVSGEYPAGALLPVQGDADSCSVSLNLPFSRPAGATLESALLPLCSKADLRVRYVGSSDVSHVVQLLQPLGFKSLRAESAGSINSFRIRYGGADCAVIAAVLRELRSLTGTDPSVTKDWGDHDLDVFVDIPESIASVLPRGSRSSTIVPMPAAGVRTRTRFMRRGKGPLKVGDVTLRVRHTANPNLVPPAAEFSGYCLDQPTAETLRHLALSVLLSEPCLLEGPTGTSKTSSVRYLASQLGQPVVRVNLNGQTDTGELVGKFVPRTGTGSGEESPGPWAWQDGLLVQAMRSGWWVILDEVNLAEPQVLERLNSVLEETPSLTLTEFDNSVLGPGGQPIHPDFRLFATMNPADYAGRSVLSPAWRDRWRATRTVPAATEAEYAALLHQSITGRAPSVVVAGTGYDQPRAPAPFAALRRLRGMETLIEALARFHVGVERAAGGALGSSAHLGAGRKEPYVFTRRSVRSVLRFLQHLVASGSKGCAHDLVKMAVARYYVAQCNTPEDRGAIEQLLEASIGSPPPERADRELEDLLKHLEAAG